MSERKWTWLILAILLALAALSGCATVEPTRVAKPSIPDDLRLVCYQGVIAVYSESAEQALISNVQCDVTNI